MELNNGGNLTRDPKSIFENTENESRSEQNEELVQSFFDDQIDSNCSTPYVSAPSSPGRGSGPVNGGFYYSAPASPMHFALTASYPVLSSSSPDNGNGGSSVGVGFEFGFGSVAMSSADELFLDGKIRPMKLSAHLERPQVLAPLLDLDEQEEEEEKDDEISVSSKRGRDLRVVRDKSMRRRARSLSPLRSTSLKWDEDEQQQHKSASCLDNIQDMEEKNESSNKSEKTTATEVTEAVEAASLSASSSRSSSSGRSSKRWVFLKDFLYRSKSEGRSNNKFWSTISFPPVLHKEKKLPTCSNSSSNTNPSSTPPENNNVPKGKGNSASQVKKPVNGIGKRRVPPSPHELHYTANRAQAEEMRKKTFLPYRQGLLGCLGFSSKGYGAMNGLARALNPVSSR